MLHFEHYGSVSGAFTGICSWGLIFYVQIIENRKFHVQRRKKWIEYLDITNNCLVDSFKNM